MKIDALDIFYREAGPKNATIELLLHGIPLWVVVLSGKPAKSSTLNKYGTRGGKSEARERERNAKDEGSEVPQCQVLFHPRFQAPVSLRSASHSMRLSTRNSQNFQLAAITTCR